MSKANTNSVFASKGKWFGAANGYDCITWRDLTDSDKAIVRENFHIPLEEEIYFLRDTGFWNSKDQGAVITDRGIYVIVDNDNPEDEFIIEWTEFDRVVYKELCFYFMNGEQQAAYLGYNYLIKCDESDLYKYTGDLCKLLTAAAATQEAAANPIDLANDGRFEEALAAADNLIATKPDDAFPYFSKARAIYVQQCSLEQFDQARVEEALDYLRKANELIEPGSEEQSLIYLNFGFLYQLMGQSYNARNFFILGLEKSDDKRYVMQQIEACEDNLKDIFEEYTETYDYPERKFCMLIKDNDLGGCVTNGIDVFRQTNYPPCLKFPINHPYPNQLYIGHPYKKDFYVPFEESEDIFFMDKVNELCYLLECLGAEQIDITTVKGKRVEEMNRLSQSISGAADLGPISGEGRYSQNIERYQSSDSRTSRAFTIRLDPMTKPYLPDNLIWYAEQPQWQRLVERRIKNNILEYTESVQSSETRFTSGNEVDDIQASAEYLWMKANVNVQKNVETQFRTSTDTVWNISVRFRSMKDYGDDLRTSSPKALTAEEKEYLDEVKFCLEEDGVITPKEERMLDRLRSRLGITPERASELMMELAPAFTPEEQEYADEIKACLEDDGIITDREMRMLDRMASRLGITESRAAEIRNSIIR